MKKFIGESEWFPIYCLSDDDMFGDSLRTDIPEELINQLNENLDEFDRIQRELKKYHREAYNKANGYTYSE